MSAESDQLLPEPCMPPVPLMKCVWAVSLEKSPVFPSVLLFWGKWWRPCSPDIVQIHWGLLNIGVPNEHTYLELCKPFWTSNWFTRYSPLNRKPKRLIQTTVKNDQKFHLQFYPKFLIENGAFLPEYSNPASHAFSPGMERIYLIRLLTATPHSLHKSFASQMALAQSSFFHLSIRSNSVLCSFSDWHISQSDQWKREFLTRRTARSQIRTCQRHWQLQLHPDVYRALLSQYRAALPAQRSLFPVDAKRRSRQQLSRSI